MVDSYTQDKRLGELLTPIGTNALVLSKFVADEWISEPFLFEIAAFSETNIAVDFEPALGENVTTRITSVSGEERYFTGTLIEASYTGHNNNGYYYDLVLRPWFWLLTKQTRSQVFHNLNVKEIVAKVFGDHGSMANFEDRLERSYPVIEYCVQHRESDFNFVSRLLEAHGIGYFYEFAKDRQTLVLADTPTSYPVAPMTKRKVGWIAAEDREEECFYEWWPLRHFATEKVLRNDYDFRKPHSSLKTDSSGNAGYSHHGLKDDGYPLHQSLGENTSEGESLGYTLVAMDAEQANDHRAMGYGDVVTLSPGARVVVEDFGEPGSSQEYLILNMHHEFNGNAYRPGDDNTVAYEGYVGAMSTVVNFAPARITPKPRIAGVQTGRVAGKDEFDTDEYGRLKVYFHWMDQDKENQLEGISMWCRVAQVWSGPGWGGQFIPRQGMEVLVQFIDGDPDQPVIVGTLYNGDNKFPFALPDDKYTSGWKSRSSYGGEEDFNEISMKDNIGEELLKFHAQRDLLTEVEHNEQRDIGNDRATTISNNDTLDIGRDLTITAGNSITLKVGMSTIVMDGASITLTSSTVKIQADNFDANGRAMAAVVSGGQLTLTGMLVKIN